MVLMLQTILRRSRRQSARFQDELSVEHDLRV